MSPMAALEYVRSRRPRVLLASSQWQAVQEYSRRKLEFPAIQNPKSTYSVTGDEVFIIADDLEGYSVEDENVQRISLFKASQTRTITVMDPPRSPTGEDQVLITEADLVGYETSVDACDKNNQTRPMTRKLSCLFASLKSSTGSQPVTSRLPAIRAC